MRIIIKIKNNDVVSKLMRYGVILSKFSFTNAVGMEVRPENVDKIRGLEGIESIKVTEKVKLLR